MLPKYLTSKLAEFQIYTQSDLIKYDYLKLFKWLKYTNKSLSYKTLFDLHCLFHNLPLNSLDNIEQKRIVQQYALQKSAYPPLSPDTLTANLKAALVQAELANSCHEIPIGAVVVKGGQIVASGYNQTLTCSDITKHAEIVALQAAQKVLGNHRLNECDLYVTIEPCLMCVGAILHSRIRRLIFGAIEPKTGAVCSQYNALDNCNVNHQTEALGPINNEKYSQSLKQFLINKRNTLSY